jgi:hypothetical protein
MSAASSGVAPFFTARAWIFLYPGTSRSMPNFLRRVRATSLSSTNPGQGVTGGQALLAGLQLARKRMESEERKLARRIGIDESPRTADTGLARQGCVKDAYSQRGDKRLGFAAGCFSKREYTNIPMYTAKALSIVMRTVLNVSKLPKTRL